MRKSNWCGCRMIATALVAATMAIPASAGAQAPGVKETTSMVQRALRRLPYYGVFDFLAFSVNRGVVTVDGFAYREALKKDASAALRRLDGIDEIANRVQVLPTSQNDDRIRWATFYKIYTDDFLSRYAPGGAMAARYEALSFARFPDMQPFGTYPIHIVVRDRRTMLLGVVDNESDKILAGVRAREVATVIDVENDLAIERK